MSLGGFLNISFEPQPEMSVNRIKHKERKNIRMRNVTDTESYFLFLWKGE